MRHLHLDWSSQIYIPSWMNFDLFFGGMLLNSFTQNSKDNKVKKWLRPVSLLLLFILILYCMLTYKAGHITFQRFYAPSIIILIFLLIMYSFDSKDKSCSFPINLKNIIKNPLRIIDVIGIISFGAYMYHSYLFSIMPEFINNPKIFPSAISN